MHLATYAISIWTLVSIGLLAYALVVGVLIVIDNRSPASSWAWLLTLWAFPVIGLLLYLFFGRGYKAFSRDRLFADKVLRSGLRGRLAHLLSRQNEYVRRLEREKPESYQARLINLAHKNPASVLTVHNRIAILQNAEEKYPALLADMCAAQHSIHLLYYIWSEDEFTLQVKDILIDRARAGVKVRVLVDASGFGVSEAYRREMSEAGVEVHPYLEYMRLSRLHLTNYRNHRKIVVIDGRIGYLGGMNLDVEQITGRNPVFPFWRDTHLRIEGEAALALQYSFAASWLITTGQVIQDPNDYPPVWEQVSDFTPITITQSGPDSQWAAIRQLYFYLITAAQKSVYLQSPFFIPDETLVEAIRSAAMAGVDVRIMVTPAGAKYQLPYRAAHTYFANVARAGARIYLYRKGYMHAKTVMIDGAVCMVGTANIDIRSFGINYETNAVIYDAETTRHLEDDFKADLKDCEEWTLAQYRRLPFRTRLRDSVYRLLSPLL
jgi:cardiolipin synthase